MATSSITKNFVISGKEQVEMFVNAIEESAKNRPVRTPANVKFIETEEELREFMRFRVLTNYAWQTSQNCKQIHHPG